MAEIHEFEISRREFLKSAVGIGMVAAAGGSIPLTMFASGCPSGNAPAGDQVLNVNLAGEPESIDPNLSSWAASRSVISQVFEGVLGFDKDLKVIPVIAKEIPTVANKGISADGKTYTFNLKNNVKWSDGKAVTAKDFEYSIKRFLDPANAAEYASMYYSIAGAEAYNGGKGAVSALGVKAVNDSTLEIKLAAAQPTFLQLMALWPVYPVREDIITAKGEEWTEAGNYIGTGPFLMTEWVHQDHITFKQNPNYWGAKPKLTQVTYKMITDANAALAAYQAGELDMSGVPIGTEKATMQNPALSPEIKRNADLTTFAFQFNVNKAPFNNIKVRQALSCAIDRVSFVDKVRGGVGRPTTSWVPPGMPGFDANLGKENDFNVATAKARLADAGYSDVSKLPELKFQFSDTASNKTIAQFLQGQLKDNLGINLTLEPMESKAFSTMVNSEGHTWAWFGWGADYPDPENFMDPNFKTKAGNNHTGWSNAQFDDLCRQALVELDNTKRLKFWDDAHKIVIQECPAVFMFNRERFNLVKPYFKGLTPTGMDGQIMGDQFWTNVTIQK
jgi:oligopeptide transport system substrate-binding protein